MTRYRKSIAVLLLASLALIVACSTLTGCATDPATKAYQTRQTYVATLTALDQMAVAGKLKPADAKTIQLLRPIADAAEAALTQATPGTPLYATALDAFSRIVDQFVAAKIAAGGK